MIASIAKETEAAMFPIRFCQRAKMLTYPPVEWLANFPYAPRACEIRYRDTKGHFQRPLAFAIALFAAVLAGGPAAALDRAAVERQFQDWIGGELWPLAKKAAVSRKTFAAETAGLSLDWELPDLRPPGTPERPPDQQRQSEFRAPKRYFNESNLDNLVKNGRALRGKWGDTLKAVEARFGVPDRIVLAIWGRESGYGRASIPHDAIRVLASEAFMGARKEIFVPEIVAALKILDEGHIRRERMKSSWAGALGQPQFLPTKFLKYAVDFDGDGRRDIWDSVPDSLASIANYLKAHGWQSGRDWGFEAEVPTSVSCALEGPEQGRKISDWIGRGITRIKGRDFPAAETARTGYLLMPAGRSGPAFIATENFYILKTYNESDLYALFIGHLADRYGSNAGFVANWGDVDGFSRGDVHDMQVRLQQRGYDVGGADGLVGFKTRTAIGSWQEKAGMAATCFPDKGLIAKIE